MAKTLHDQYLTCIFLINILLFFFGSSTTTAKSDGFSRNISPETALGLKQKKLTHLHFYFHDVVSGQNPTAVAVAEAATTNSSASRFGAMVMMDNALTIRPERSSKLVGRAQGIYASASQSEISFLMVLNFVFTEGKYNGSSLSVLGRNTILSSVREMPIVGGSGVFRFARGYAEARSHTFDLVSMDAVVEYEVYVFHY